MGNAARASAAAAQANARALMESDHRVGTALPHGANAVCPKCGYDPSAPKSPQPFGRQYIPEGVSPVAPGEHLVTTCALCRYVWREDCRDADGGRKPLEVVGSVREATA